jgi:hypothetical protein
MKNHWKERDVQLKRHWAASASVAAYWKRLVGGQTGAGHAKPSTTRELGWTHVGIGEPALAMDCNEHTEKVSDGENVHAKKKLQAYQLKSTLRFLIEAGAEISSSSLHPYVRTDSSLPLNAEEIEASLSDESASLSELSEALAGGSAATAIKGGSSCIGGSASATGVDTVAPPRCGDLPFGMRLEYIST